MQRKHEFPSVCLWKSGTLSPLKKMFSCTLQTSSTKIVLLTSKPHPEQQVSIQLTLAVPSPPPDSIWLTQALWYYNRHAYYRRNVALFSPFREQEGETTYFGRLSKYFVKYTKYSWSWSLPTTTAPGLIECQLLKAEVEDCIGREALWSCYWRQNEVLRFFLSIGSQHIITFVFNSYTGNKSECCWIHDIQARASKPNRLAASEPKVQ